MYESNSEVGDWENYITLNSNVDKNFRVLGQAKTHIATDSRLLDWHDLDYDGQLALDVYPIPEVEDREGYFGLDHFSYWASGLRDSHMLLNLASELGVDNPRNYLDLGCASGRVTRHMHLLRPNMKTMGCDINRSHVEWCNKYLPTTIITFQNSSIPILPIESNSIDILSAYSVFTHIEAMETTWLMEIRRILRPGGIAWITIHSEKTLSDMDSSWPLWKPIMEFPEISKKINTQNQTFQGDRLIIRWHKNKSYSSNIFYKEEYVRRHWGRIMEVAQFHRRYPRYQDVVILKKSVNDV